MNRVCNEDCLHCPYEDCILDEVTPDAYHELHTIQSNFIKPKSEKQQLQIDCNHQLRKQKRKEYHKQYREKNRERLIAKDAKYKQDHLEECRARGRLYYEVHADEIKAKHKVMYAKNRKEILAKQAIYAAAHKEKIKRRQAKYHASHREELKKKMPNTLRLTVRKSKPIRRLTIRRIRMKLMPEQENDGVRKKRRPKLPK